MSSVQSVDRALNIMEIISDYSNGLGITDISEKSSLHKSTVHRILKTLIDNGYVEQDGVSKNYLITFKLYNLGKRKIENLDIVKVAKPSIEILSTKVKETVHLVIRDGADVVYIDKVEADNTINMSSKVGRRSPVYCTSVGKSMLAYETDEVIKSVWDESNILKYTENTIIDYNNFLRELAKVKELGYALDNEENEIGVVCIGAPIFDHTNKVIGAISISGPSNRIENKGIETLKEEILKMVKNISRDLGYISNE